MRAVVLSALVVVLAGTVWGQDAEGLPGRIDVSGARGANGMHGSPGSHTGEDGTHAGPSTRGQHAGRLVLRVERGDDERFLVRGVQTRPRSQGMPEFPEQPLERMFRIGERGFLELRARGGVGGRGGNGGNGARGADGSDGSDASCSSSGGDGGDGGPGGDGGNATPGSDGGDGGDMQVTVAPEDTHLLLLVVPQNEGGRGGAGGSNGLGGPGGAGGSGGSSHSSHGECSGNPGGSSGSSGPSGRNGTGSTQAGDDGEAGRWTIRVGERRYERRYWLRLNGFDVVSDNHDGVIEPGELVHVQRITARNEGAVPTPPPNQHATRIYLPLTRNVTKPSDALLLPESLLQGGVGDVPGELRFRVPDVDTETVVLHNERYADEGLIDLHAHLVDVRRDYPEFPAPRTFPIGFPLGVEPLRLASASAAGESHRFVLEATNRSRRAYGETTSEPASQRTVRVTFRLNERSLGASGVELLIGPEGRVHDLSRPLEWSIPTLPAGASAKLQLSLAVRPDAPAYAGADLDLELWFGQLEDRDRRRIVERRRLPLRVAARWQDPERPSLLLVTNVGVEREVVSAWKQLAAGLGLGVAIWDVSYYGFLPLGKRTVDRSDVLLMEEVPGQVMVVLNNAFSSPIHDGQGRRVPVRAARFLEGDQVLRAAIEANVRTLILGETPRGAGPWERNDGDMLLPRAVEEEREHEDLAALLAAVADEAHAAHGVLHRVEVWDSWLWGRPRQVSLEEAAHELQTMLLERFPARRYVVGIQFAPLLDDGWLWNSIRHGKLLVRRTQDGHRGAIDRVAMSDQALAANDYVASQELLERFVGAMAFEQKLDLLRRFLDGELPRPGPGAPSEEALAEALSETITADLRRELDLWTKESWSGFRASGSYREEMSHHQALSKVAPKAGPLSEGPRARCVEDIVYHVRAHAQRRWGVWDVVTPLHARRYYAVAAAAGTPFGSGLIDDFAASCLAGEARRGHYWEQRPSWKVRRGQDALRGPKAVFRGKARAAAKLRAAKRKAARAAFLEALDRLHGESFMPETLDAPDDGGERR